MGNQLFTEHFTLGINPTGCLTGHLADTDVTIVSICWVETLFIVLLGPVVVCHGGADSHILHLQQLQLVLLSSARDQAMCEIAYCPEMLSKAETQRVRH